tara:strand:- start:102824 stop:103231 length:408 start_codon:yes stop_codon:yes gene_type:complete
MSLFETLLENDPDLLIRKKEAAERVLKEKNNRIHQVETVKKGKLIPHLSLGPYFQNTSKLQEKIIKESNERIKKIKASYREFRFKRAEELSSHDPKGYDKWLEHEKLKLKVSKTKRQFREQEKEQNKHKSQNRHR